MKKLLAVAVTIFSLCGLISSSRAEPLETGGNMVYFVMLDRFANGDTSNDMGGLGNNAKISGFNPSDVGFYHGGDLKGIQEKIPYIKSLGFTAIWISPIARQIAVSPDGGSAAYHGYWGAGFDQVDPHLGTMMDFKNFVDDAHKVGLKVILDIVINHTADVVQYQEGNTYVSIGEKPYRSATGKIFNVSSVAGSSKFPQLSANKSFGKTPFIYAANRAIKSPSWLNNVLNYHNRGDSTFAGESSLFGDFMGLDDVFTEKPEVVSGMITTYTNWIKNTKIDGFRIDTARHVNEAFWNKFLPAMRKAALENGVSYFPMWGEVYDTDTGNLSYWIKNANHNELLDFAFQDRVINYITQKTAFPLANLFNDDDQYITAGNDPKHMGTFLGNHDMGRVASFIGLQSGEVQSLKKDQIAHVLLFTLRGSPIVYYGDEFGLMGGSDKEARQDLFSTQVSSWQTQKRIGQDPIGTKDSFSTANPIQETIKALTSLRKVNDNFVTGSQKIRYAKAGVFAFSRFSQANQKEFLVVTNINSDEAIVDFNVGTTSTWKKVLGSGDLQANGKSVTMTIPGLSWAIFEPNERNVDAVASVSLSPIKIDELNSSQLRLDARIVGSDFANVSFYYRNKGKSWVLLGMDDSSTYSNNPPDANIFRVYPNKNLFMKGIIEFKAVVNKNGQEVTSEIRTFTIK